MKRVIDYKAVDMTDEEFDYYKKLVQEFTFEMYDGKAQFQDLFDVDDDGCISMIRPSLGKEVAWAVLIFLQNLLLNQRTRRIENKVEAFLEKYGKEKE